MSVSDDAIIEVRNLVDYMVVYRIDEDHIRREFAPGEVKKVTAIELRKLYYTPGGGDLLKNFLSVRNAELASEFGVSSDTIEYNWTVSDIDKTLLVEPIEVLLDALDFAPDGIKETIVDRAVALKINNMDKRKAILEKTGQDITQKIDFKEALESQDNKQDSAPKERRVNTGTQTVNTGRRVQTQVSIIEEAK